MVAAVPAAGARPPRLRRSRGGAARQASGALPPRLVAAPPAAGQYAVGLPSGEMLIIEGFQPAK